MISYKRGNVLDAPVTIIAHGCNCQGAFGAGVAKAVARKYPEVKRQYLELYRFNGLQLATIQPVSVSDSLVIMNMMTQKYYGRGGRRYVSYEAIKSCFTKLRAFAENQATKLDGGSSIAIPYIGAGLAGGDWNIINEIINNVWNECEIPLSVYSFK